MAGLCAARVLSKFYDKVTVIDRDAYPAGAHERPGVPQSRHVHALLMRGRLELDRLFPGFEKTMLERGAIEINFGRDFAALRADGWAERRPNSITTLFASRVLIEETVRELLRRIPNVELIERAEAVGFETVRGDSIRVSGVKVNPRDGGACVHAERRPDRRCERAHDQSSVVDRSDGLAVAARDGGRFAYRVRVAMVQRESRAPPEGLVVEGNLDRSDRGEFLDRGRAVPGRRQSNDCFAGGDRRTLSAERRDRIHRHARAIALADNRRGSRAGGADVAGLFVSADGESLAAL